MDISDFSAGNLFVTGELGSGKTMYSIMLIREYLRAGRPVVTNLDIYLEEMFQPDNKKTLTRIPDKPTRDHFDQLGDSYDVASGYDESKFGLIVLDECLTWLNSRGWQDKERAKVLDWFLHARKHGWNVCFLMQSADYCDPQLRETLLTYHVSCRKMGKYKVPFIGKALGLRLPKGTLATITAGYGTNAMAHDREIYRGEDLYKAYNTAQVFVSGFEFIGNDFIDMRASYTTLSAWHLKGRYLEESKQEKRRTIASHAGIALNYLIWHYLRPIVLVMLFPIYPDQVAIALKSTK